MLQTRTVVVVKEKKGGLVQFFSVVHPVGLLDVDSEKAG